MNKYAHLLLLALATGAVVAGFAVLGFNIRHLDKWIAGTAVVCIVTGFGMGWSADFDKATEAAKKLVPFVNRAG